MSETNDICFDSSLPLLVGAVKQHLGPIDLENGMVVRDTSGRLRFIVRKDAPSDEERDRLNQLLAAPLGPYARQDGVIAYQNDSGAQQLLSDLEAFVIHQDAIQFSLLDRRIVGSSWLNTPVENAAGPVRIVFASVKGGVGRSTALAVAAADLARRNKNILVVDLDLEAPGIGDMLLDQDRLPSFGVLDYLVENGLVAVAEGSLADYIGTSSLTTPSGGRVDVLPAFGKQSDQHPENTLPKLARALIEDISPDGMPVPLSRKMASMIDRFARLQDYDAILIDSRAGLSEIAAPAVLGLGATVLLFGTAQRQTIHGYAPLLAGLKMLVERDYQNSRPAEWRSKLKAVLAKAGDVEGKGARYKDDLFDLFAENLYDQETTDNASEIFSYSIDDDGAPHWPLVIRFDPSFVDFDPMQAPSQLGQSFYESAFRPFLNGIDKILASANQIVGRAGEEQ